MSFKKLFFSFCFVAVLAFFGSVLIKSQVGGLYIIASDSMEPSLGKKTWVFINKTAYHPLRKSFKAKSVSLPKRGDIVLARLIHRDLAVKRIIGIPGDLIEWKANRLYVNGELSTFQDENFHSAQREFREFKEQSQHKEGYEIRLEKLPSTKPYSVRIKKNSESLLTVGPKRIPLGHYFIMGDNREHSADSRFIPPAYSKGKGIATFSRVRPGGAVSVPEKTILYGRNSFKELELFVTLKDHTITGLFKDIKVQALMPGLNGNIPSGALTGIKGALSEDFHVGNLSPFSGGRDESLVPLENISGRVVKF